MTEYSVTIVTANYRDLDGCDSDAAVDAILAAAQKAAAEYADENGLDITVTEPEFPRDRQSRTIIVGWYIPRGDDCDADYDADYEADRAAQETANDIAEVVGTAADRCVENGDWEDAASDQAELGR